MADLTKGDTMSMQYKVEKLIECIQDAFVKVPASIPQIEISLNEFQYLKGVGGLTSYLAAAGFDMSGGSFDIVRHTEKGTIILKQKQSRSDTNGPGKNPNYFLFQSQEEARNYCYYHDLDTVNLRTRECRHTFDFQDIQMSHIPDIASFLIKKLQQENFQFGEKLSINFRYDLYSVEFCFRQYSLEKKVVENSMPRPIPSSDVAKWEGDIRFNPYLYPRAKDITDSQEAEKERFMKAYLEMLKNKDIQFPQPYTKLDAEDTKKSVDMLEKTEKSMKAALETSNKPLELLAPAPTPSRLEFFDADKIEELIGD